MNDKDRDKWIKYLNDNQKVLSKHSEILVKNNNVFIPQIKEFFKKNEAQDKFDKSVVDRLKQQDKKIGEVLELHAQVKELTNEVAELKKGFGEKL